MNASKYAGLILLAALWLLLVCTLFKMGGFNLKNLFLTVASGIIIFVPLWKKYAGRSNHLN